MRGIGCGASRVGNGEGAMREEKGKRCGRVGVVGGTGKLVCPFINFDRTNYSVDLVTVNLCVKDWLGIW